VTKGVDILLVDDDLDFVAATRLVLEEAGYGVRIALRGQAGLDLARQRAPDLIILDIIMPDQDGFMVCEALKSDPELCHVPVMMLTSFAERVSETSLALRQGMMLEAEDYVDKPVRPPELLRRIEKLLARWKQPGKSDQ
jgi:two-component system alkaline phosphatase synthesis response regulator PhoP